MAMARWGGGLQVELEAPHHTVKKTSLMYTQLALIPKSFAFSTCLRKALGGEKVFHNSQLFEPPKTVLFLY